MPLQIQQQEALTVCDVCRLLDQDVEIKPCAYCSLCDSWICQEDLDKKGRRALAALKKKLENFHSNYSTNNK